MKLLNAYQIEADAHSMKSLKAIDFVEMIDMDDDNGSFGGVGAVTSDWSSEGCSKQHSTTSWPVWSLVIGQVNKPFNKGQLHFSGSCEPHSSTLKRTLHQKHTQSHIQLYNQ